MECFRMFATAHPLFDNWKYVLDLHRLLIFTNAMRQQVNNEKGFALSFPPRFVAEDQRWSKAIDEQHVEHYQYQYHYDLLPDRIIPSEWRIRFFLRLVSTFRRAVKRDSTPSSDDWTSVRPRKVSSREEKQFSSNRFAIRSTGNERFIDDNGRFA